MVPLPNNFSSLSERIRAVQAHHMMVYFLRYKPLGEHETAGIDIFSLLKMIKQAYY